MRTSTRLPLRMLLHADGTVTALREACAGCALLAACTLPAVRELPALRRAGRAGTVRLVLTTLLHLNTDAR